eukprot:1157536-Pelagomonas_calceolata.AAC.2
MVFFSSCASVKYHAELLNYIDIPVKDIHGKQKQQKRTATFFEFCQAEKGILLCTDVAARGLDIPGVCARARACVYGLSRPCTLTHLPVRPLPCNFLQRWIGSSSLMLLGSFGMIQYGFICIMMGCHAAVDWIIQYDPPDDPKEYIHRVGRTARGKEGRGRALLLLMPEELLFLKYLKEARVPLNEYEFPTNKVSNVQSQLERLVEKNYYLHQSAKDAYRAYLLSYNSHALKEIFNVHRLPLQAVAKSFGFSVPPRVTLALESKSKHTRKAAKLMAQLGARSGKGKAQDSQADYKRVSGHAFSAANPRGKRDSSDKRQFVRL